MKEELWLWFSSWKTDGLEKKPWEDFCTRLEGKTICSDGNVGSSLLLLCTCYSFFGSVLFKGVGECASRRSGIRCQTALVEFNQVRFLLFPHFQTTGFLFRVCMHSRTLHSYPHSLQQFWEPVSQYFQAKNVIGSSFHTKNPHRRSVFIFGEFSQLGECYFRKWKKNQKIVIFRDFLCIKQASFPGIVSVVRWWYVNPAFWESRSRISVCQKSCVDVLGRILTGQEIYEAWSSIPRFWGIGIFWYQLFMWFRV